MSLLAIIRILLSAYGCLKRRNRESCLALVAQAYELLTDWLARPDAPAELPGETWTADDRRAWDEARYGATDDDTEPYFWDEPCH